MNSRVVLAVVMIGLILTSQPGTVKGDMTTAVVGAIAGGVAVGVGGPLILSYVGLSAVGPVAGGWFATSMGAAVAPGSAMAAAQSVAMAGVSLNAILAGVGIGAAAGAVAK